MIGKLLKNIGRLAVVLATMAFLTGVGLFVLGSFLMTWPILRLSPREQRLRATADFVASGITMLTVYQQKIQEKRAKVQAAEPSQAGALMESEDES